MNKLLSLNAFRYVVELGSFTAAAKQLQVSPAMVSKYLAALEQDLGIRLLTRSTRSVRLTEQGEHYYQDITPLLDELQAADLKAGAGSISASGELRLTAQVDLGEQLLPPLIAEFQQRYPEVSVSLDLSDRPVDLYSENYDLALRVGKVKSPDLVVRKLTSAEFLLCASPQYLIEASPLDHPRDLANHNCLLNPHIHNAHIWGFNVEGKILRQNVSSKLSINRAQALRQAEINHQGVVFLPRLIVEDALEQGLLVEKLQQYIVPTLDVFLVYPERRYLPAKVRCFIDTVFEHSAE